MCIFVRMLNNEKKTFNKDERSKNVRNSESKNVKLLRESLMNESFFETRNTFFYLINNSESCSRAHLFNVLTDFKSLKIL